MTEPPPSITGVATGVVDTLKTLPPIFLVLVLLNMAFAASAAWYLTGIENKRSEFVKLMLDRCLPANNIFRKE